MNDVVICVIVGLRINQGDIVDNSLIVNIFKLRKKNRSIKYHIKFQKTFVVSSNIEIARNRLVDSSLVLKISEMGR